MLIERYAQEDVFARVPAVAAQTDPVLRQLDRLLDDDVLFNQEKRRPGAAASSNAVVWSSLDAGRSHLAPAHHQAPVSVEFPRNRKSGH
jgi:hypothetical protein